MIVTIEETQQRLEELCDAAIASKDIVISRHGVPVVRLVSIRSAEADGAF